MNGNEGVQTMPDPNEVVLNEWEPLDEPRMKYDIRKNPLAIVAGVARKIGMVIVAAVAFGTFAELSDPDRHIPFDQRERRLDGVVHRGEN